MSLLSILTVVLTVTSVGAAWSSFFAQTRPRMRLGWHLGSLGLCVLAVGAMAIAGPTARLPLPAAVRVCVVGWATEGPLGATSTATMRWVAVFAVGWLAGVGLWRAWCRIRFRRQHRADLGAIATPLGTTVCSIDHPEPVVYCLGGRRPVIVTTTAATERLSAEELLAVLAHERAHLAGHHTAVRAVIDSIATAWPWLPAARVAQRDVPVILECLADDRATRHHAPASLASAICRLVAAHPHGTVGAAGHEVLRVTRLCARHTGRTDVSSPGWRRWPHALVATIGAATTLVAAATCSA